MKIIASEDFRVPVSDVLDGAQSLHSVVVVGIASDGSLEVFSSVGTPQTLNLLAQAAPRIEQISRS